MNILCLGAIVCDIAIKPLPEDAFEKKRITIDSLNMSGGGDANNASTDLAILGENVRIVSAVGNDFIGEYLLKQLGEKGVGTQYVKQDAENATTSAVLMLGTGGSTVISARRNGACDLICEADVTDEALEWADHLHVVNVLNMPNLDGAGLARLFKRAKEKGVTTSMDLKRPRNAHEKPMDCIKEALNYCDVFLPSNYEIEYLLGDITVEQARDYFANFGLKVFGIKRGELGVYITDFKEEIYQQSLYKGTPVDVVGAGDAFSSTFAASWKRGYSLRDAAVIASAASANVLSEIGTTKGMKNREALLEYAARAGYAIEAK